MKKDTYLYGIEQYLGHHTVIVGADVRLNEHRNRRSYAASDVAREKVEHAMDLVDL